MPVACQGAGVSTRSSHARLLPALAHAPQLLEAKQKVRQVINPAPNQYQIELQRVAAV
jgi:hypothetical protein